MSYDVTVTREDGSWLADVHSVPGAHTFARSLAGLVESVREVIVLMADLPDDAQPDVTLTFDVSDPLVIEAAALGRARRELAERETAVRDATADTARSLTGAGYSVRDTAVLLAMTPGRVSQVAKPAPRPRSLKRTG